LDSSGRVLRGLTMSRPGSVQHLLRVARSLLVKADDSLLANTEYLRDELNDLLIRMDELLEKMADEHELLRLKDALHDQPEEKEDPATGIRSRTVMEIKR